jgi:SAM-dependent methyltransferase
MIVQALTMCNGYGTLSSARINIRMRVAILRRRWNRLWKLLAPRGRERHVGVVTQWNQLASESFVRDLERVSWTGIPQVHSNHNYLISGSRDAYWVEWIRERYFPGGDAGDALSLGCGAGHLDRILRRCGFTFRSFTGIDLSENAINRARELAHEIGLAPKIRYVAEDLNRCELAPQSFDFIYFFQSLHHLEALEHVLGQCQRALRPGGLLLVNEFVGPSRFQWTSRQVEMANTLTRLLPEDLRRDLQAGGIKTEIVCPTVRHMVAHDPSEAVRSGEIERLLKADFDVLEEWNWGGTLNHLVFQNIAANFDPENEYHRSIVELLIHHENVLVREGLLPSDFKVFVAKLKR